jgi:hypothetical protein
MTGKTIRRVFLVAMLGTHLFFLWTVRSRIAKGDPDFTAFYTAGELLREGRGRELYDAQAQLQLQQAFASDSDIRHGALPYIHPPFEALIFVPLTFLPYLSAFALWNLVNLGMLVAISILLRGALDALRDVPVWEWVLAVLAFFPVFANLLQGQDAILLLLVSVLAYRSLQSNADFTAGCWLGAGIFRYHLAIPLVLILVLWGRRKLAAGFATVSSAAVLLSFAIVGWSGALKYPAYMWQWASALSYGRTPPRLMPNLLGLLTGWSAPDAEWRWPLQFAVLVCSVGLLVGMVRMRHLANDRQFLDLSLASAVIAALLLSYNTSTYDMCLLVLPIAFLADHCIRERSRFSAVWARVAFPAIPFLVSPVWFFLWRRWEKTNLMAIFLLWWLYAIIREMSRMNLTTEAGDAALTSHDN